ncbi:uracil-DNA glycosylase [Acuticoccus sp. MNP-M23]|uniref:uracil-DNA glycosylase n=1 Tax=Acuticoccus sp. MNP-M23 TaxID=3072793 RepID=UPI00281648F2|nr:uracil-DNA glycosylase [Acuticoccus sp. MNP-M23]WMS42045.1 uracil-DNA glycosylase [Acuticoccus sp. MNP-M23]
MPVHESAREAILSFYEACGVTTHLSEAPIDRFALAEAPPETRELQAPINAVAADVFDDAPPADTVPAFFEDVDDDFPEDGGPVNDARSMARAATTLDALHKAVASFEGCALKATARRTVKGEGPLGAALMFVGEAPGAEEDESGRPFVGRSGKLLERMLAAIGLDRSDVYITNVIAWRPPGNRTPSPVETATCEAFVRREIALVRPRILVPLGGPSAKTLLRNDVGITRQRGRWTRYEDEDGLVLDAMAMFHPAYLLRTPAEKRRAWVDLLALKARLDQA